MQTVYFNYTMMPADFKKRNQKHIDDFDSLCFHDDTQKPEGSPVKKGDDILSFSFYPDPDSFSIQSPIDGYIHYDVDGIALLDGSHYRKVKICDIYEDFNELIRTLYNNEYEFTVDEFTGKEEFHWTKVAGQPSMGFRFEEYLISFLIIEHVPYLAFGDTSVPKQLIFLFADKSKLSYDLQSCQRVGGFLTLVPLYKGDLQLFIDNQLYKFRVFHSDIPATVGFQRPLDVILFQQFARHFVAIMEDIGIDWKSLEKPSFEPLPKSGECFVYLMHDMANGYYKIGISNKPEYRERTLQSEKPTIELVSAKQFPSRVIAEAIEAALHKAFGEKRIRGEWFNLNDSEVEQIKQTLK